MSGECSFRAEAGRFVHVGATHMDSTPVCDFCGNPHPQWRYQTESFSVPIVDSDKDFFMSVGDWAACNECADLIDARREFDLLLRASKSHPLVRAGGITYRQAMSIAGPLHTKFWQFKKPTGRERIIPDGDD